jgi:two-component system, NarL family, response regulator NreC
VVLNRPIRVVIVDDHGIERRGVRLILDAEPDICVVGEAEDGLAALRVVASLTPDVVLTETLMPRMNGLELAVCVQKRYPEIKVLVLTRDESAKSVLRLVQAGVSGYLLKTASNVELTAAVRSVASGAHALQRRAFETVICDYQELAHHARVGGRAKELTSREREVLKLIAEGHSTHEIADILSVSPKTVEAHRAKMMEKLCVHKATGLAIEAVREGLVSVED